MLELKPAKPWWKRKATIALAGCLVLAGLLYPLVAPHIERLLRQNELRQLTAVPLTALPGYVWSPTFSPDGSQIAFLWYDKTYAKDGGLYVKVIGNDKPVRLTPDVRGQHGRRMARTLLYAEGPGMRTLQSPSYHHWGERSARSPPSVARACTGLAISVGLRMESNSLFSRRGGERLHKVVRSLLGYIGTDSGQDGLQGSDASRVFSTRRLSCLGLRR